jgi:hypothetical protein
MVSVRAIFLACVTGNALLQDPRFFPSKEAFPFLLGRLEVHFQVLAPGEAVVGLAGFADFPGKLDSLHTSGSFPG